MDRVASTGSPSGLADPVRGRSRPTDEPDDNLLVAGVDIGGTQCSVNLGRLRGGELRLERRDQFRTDVHRGPDRILADIGARMDRALEHAAAAWRESVAGIGITCGGPLDRAAGVIQGPPNLPGWDDVPVTEWLAKRYDLPCALENDANGSALAEWRFGAGRGCRHLIYLTFGTGLGAGMILGGTLYRGAGSLAGEVGHWRLGGDGDLASYGKPGSWQGYCSGNGIAQSYAHLDGGSGAITAREIAERARAGEPLAQQVFARAATELGRGVALLVDALAPEVVVIGGIFGYAHDLLRAGMAQTLSAEALPAILTRTRVVPAALGARVGSFGCCCVALAAFGDRVGASADRSEG